MPYEPKSLPLLTITLTGQQMAGKSHTVNALVEHFKKAGRLPFVFDDENPGPRRHRKRPPTEAQLTARGCNVLIIDRQ
jgi:hypothetical protein